MILIAGAGGGIGDELLKYYTNRECTYGCVHKQEQANCYRKYIDVLDLKALKEWAYDLVEIKGYYAGDMVFKDNITLINCIGITDTHRFLHSDPKEWAHVIEVNLIGTYNLLQAFIPVMTSISRIVLLSSVVPQMGIIGTTAYSASKSALWGLVKSLSKELMEEGITINGINLGYTNMGMIKKVPADIIDEIESKTVTKSLGNKMDIVSGIEFFRNSPYVTGTFIDINGGLW